MPARASQNTGFTLVELLVAVTITAIVSGLIYGCVHGITLSTDTARDKIAEVRTARGVLWMIGSEISCSFADDERAFRGVDAGEESHDGDSVFFWTSSAFGTGGARGLTPIGYYFEDRALYKELDETTWKVIDEVGAFELFYYDGEEWLQAWSWQEKGSLPRAVKVSIQIDGEWFSTAFCPAVNGIYKI